jgi:hypothetical protein
MALSFTERRAGVKRSAGLEAPVGARFMVRSSAHVPMPIRQFTAVAGQATQLAALFNAKFAAGFVGPGSYRVDMTTPVGQSTAGGKQALQHVRLVPLDGKPAIVVGSVSSVEMAAELRTFRHLAELHARRFNGARVPVDVNAHRELLRRLQQFFAANSISVVMVDLGETPMSDRPPPPRRAAGSQTAWIITGLAISFALGMGVLMLLVLRAPAKAPLPPPSASAAAPAPASS